MVIKLIGPDPPIDKQIQAHLKSNWPITADPDITKLQTTRDRIDWGYDLGDQTHNRCTIKVIDINAERQDRSAGNRQHFYMADVTLRIQYRDVDDHQPVELWNIGNEVANILFRASINQALRATGIHDLSIKDFSRDDDLEGNPEIHEYNQVVGVGFIKKALDV